MSRTPQRWERLVRLARQVRDRDESAPPGFSTRVVARADWTGEARPLLETFALRGFWAATACCAAAAAFSYFSRPVESVDDPVNEDTVAALLELS